MTAHVDGRDIDVLSVGEALVDFISTKPAISIRDADGFSRHLGGSVTNMALNVVRLGARAAVASRLGNDPFGEFLRREMERQGLITDYVTTDAELHTPLAFITQSAGTADFFICRGSDSQLSESDLPDAAIERARVVHTSAFALSREPARATVLHALHHAHTVGCLVSLDPNYHPALWPDGDDFEAVLKEAYRYVDVTKPSKEDCVRLFGAACSIPESIERFLDWGAKIVALTLGSHGVILASDEKTLFRITPGLVSAVDATGAGDAYWAGLLLGLLDGYPPEKAACLAQLVAEAKLGRVGHLPAVVDRTVLYRALGTVKCKPITQSELKYLDEQTITR